MAKIICKIDLGMLKQDLFIESQKYSGKPTLEKFSLTLDEIPSFIAKQKDIKDIYIKGANKTFLEKIEHDTKKLEYNLYNQDTKYFHYI